MPRLGSGAPSALIAQISTRVSSVTWLLPIGSGGRFSTQSRYGTSVDAGKANCSSMFPQVAVLSGMFELIRAFGLYNNLLGLMISYMIFTLPFTVWVLTTFMRDLPKELEEAAIMDGASPWVTITKVFMPLMWPALVTTGLLAFIAAWNEFLFALTFTLTNEMRTVPAAIALISGASQFELPWGNIMAASVIVTIPVVVLVLIFQRRIVSGLTAGAVKG
jgi:trehalose/maltose transport system permease protein